MDPPFGTHFQFSSDGRHRLDVDFPSLIVDIRVKDLPESPVRHYRRELGTHSCLGGIESLLVS